MREEHEYSRKYDNGSWKSIFLGLLITLVLASFGFTWVVGDSKESKEEAKSYKESHDKQHVAEVKSLKDSQQDIKDTVKETKDDIKEIKNMLMEQKRKDRSIR